MILIVLSLFLSISTFSIFSLTVKINGINRTIINLPLSIFQYSVPISEEQLYFDTKTLEAKMDEYLDASILNYASSYQRVFDYYSSETSSYCLSDRCDICVLTVDCLIDGYYSYHRAMRYSLKEMI